MIEVETEFLCRYHRSQPQRSGDDRCRQAVCRQKVVLFGLPELLLRPVPPAICRVMWCWQMISKAQGVDMLACVSVNDVL